MPITSVTKDPEALTMTVVAEFPVPVQRLWDAYADPRQLEKFWGPVEWPATFARHDFAEGGRSDYYMTGPDGEHSAGYWKWLAMDPGKSFEVEDGFATEPGVENTEMPSMRMVFTFSETPTGSQVSTTTHFPSAEALEQLLGMGMEEGMTSAMGQMDQVITDLASYSQGIGTNAQILSDTKIRVARIIRGTVDQVWEAHHNADLMKQWLLGPDGWTMPVCDLAVNVGDRYVYEWEQEGGGNRFGFVGELLETNPKYREVTTEMMIGMEGEPARNELTLTPVDGGTLLSLVITYPSAEVRDIVLATGMTEGMETSYARLEESLV
ncbi:SRPBCC family protein [Demequina sp.]|uniref:SRPBCC family protein n=1 Tax=Demequina sp. TaxID=2050685 RepID=UPI003D116801